jgi:hypothetical protein
MERIQVFNYQTQNENGQILDHDLITEQQVLENLQNSSKMDLEEINHAINHMKTNNEALFIITPDGGKLLLSYTSRTLH